MGFFSDLVCHADSNSWWGPSDSGQGGGLRGASGHGALDFISVSTVASWPRATRRCGRVTLSTPLADRDSLFASVGRQLEVLMVIHSMLRVGVMAALPACALLAVPVTSKAQPVANLGFEQAVVQPNVPFFGQMVWPLTVPGWQHGGGADTSSVYWGLTHVGMSPWYQLLDSSKATPGLAPLQGRYGMAFSSGWSNSLEPLGNWSPAWLAQTGRVPLGMRSLHWLFEGPLTVQVNGRPLPPQAQGAASAFAADISAYAGQVVTLTFLNASQEVQRPVLLDAVHFSSVAVVPEPARVLLMLLGGLGLAVAIRSSPRVNRAAMAPGRSMGQKVRPEDRRAAQPDCR